MMWYYLWLALAIIFSICILTGVFSEDVDDIIDDVEFKRIENIIFNDEDTW